MGNVLVAEVVNFKPDSDELGSRATIIEEYQRIVVESLLTSFGLDMLLVKDQHGGDVDTIHNVEQIGKDEKMTYKNAENEKAYNNRGEYDSGKYHNNKQYREKNKRVKEQKEAGNLKDGYTGKNINKGEKTDLDHVVSAKETHDDRGRVLAEIDGAELANSDENLVATDPSINRSKKADSMDEHLDKKGDRYSEETKRKMKAKDKKARAALRKKKARKYYTGKKFLGDMSKAAGKMGLQMGARQVLGMIFTEVWFSAKEEFENMEFGSELGEFLTKLKNAVVRGFERAKVKYRELIDKFLNGAVSGVLSSICTTIVNIFTTTIKNVVKIIREVWSVLVQAFEILFINPNNYTAQEKFIEIAKLLAVGGSVVVGTLVKEAMDKICNKIPFGDVVSTFCGTLVTGIMSCTLLYFLERSSLIRKMMEYVEKMADLMSGGINSAIKVINENREQLEAYAATLINEESKNFIARTREYAHCCSNLNPSDNQLVTEYKLEMIVKQMGIKLPYEGDFYQFMSNRNNRLVYD